MKIKNYHSSKDDVRRLKDKPQNTYEEKMFTKQVSDEGFFKFSNKNPHFLRDKRFQQTLPNNIHGLQISNPCSTSLVIVVMQIKSTMTCHHTLIRIAEIKETNHTMCFQEYSGTRTSICLWWECKIVKPLWNWFGSSLKS